MQQKQGMPHEKVQSAKCQVIRACVCQLEGLSQKCQMPWRRREMEMMDADVAHVKCLAKVCREASVQQAVPAKIEKCSPSFLPAFSFPSLLFS